MKNIQPSLLGCGGTVLVLGLILYLLFRDDIGGNIVIIGGVMMAGIVLFWLLSWLYRKLKK